ncbi:MAG: hypothetical protein ACI35P_09305 [Bacillus sp. (in: firmicutes)]
MNFKMRMANLLADNVNRLIEFVEEKEKGHSLLLNHDKWYQIRLFIEEFKFQIVADELHRINRFCWNDEYTSLLVDDVRQGLAIIDEYTERNYDDLFLLTGKLHTIKHLCHLFNE